MSTVSKIGLEKDLILFISYRAGNHTFAAIRGSESYSCMESLTVVLEDMNSLIADPYIDVEGRRKLRILLGGDCKVYAAQLCYPCRLHNTIYPIPSSSCWSWE